jgi:hypothetical protein
MEVFAIIEWERRRKMGKARLVISQDLNTDKKVVQREAKEQALVVHAALQQLGPSNVTAVAAYIGNATSTTYSYLRFAKHQGLVTNSNGLWRVL